MSRPELPTGTVTFLFTDVEGSTRLLQEHGAGYAALLDEHRRALREAFARPRRRRGGHPGRRLLRRVSEGGRRGRCGGRGAAGARAAARSGCAWESTPASRSSRTRATSGSTCTARRASPRRRTAGRSSSPRRPRGLLDSDAAVRDLGEHRLKDLIGAERLYQLGDGDFPPLKTLDATNLPIAASPLVGREHELDELVAALSNGTRLLTVTGPGGTGKTRLALQVAAELVGTLRDGVFWVPLAGLSDPELVPSEVAQAIGAPDDLAGFLRGKELLLLLDNFEHLLDAAPAVSAAPRGLGRSPRARHEPVAAARVGRAGVPARAARGERCGGALRRAGSRGRARARARLHRRGDLPPPRRPSAGGRARRRADEAPRSRAAPRAPRLGSPAADGRRARRPRAPAHAARHDRVELRPARRGEQGALRAALGLRGQLPARGRRGGLRRRPRRPRGARRLEPPEADRRRPLPDAGDDPRVRARAARRLGRTRRSSGSGTRSSSPRSPSRRTSSRFDAEAEWSARLELDHDDLRAALDWLEANDPDRALELAGALGWFWLSHGHLAEGRGRLADALARSTATGRVPGSRAHGVGRARGPARRRRRGASAARRGDRPLARARRPGRARLGARRARLAARLRRRRRPGLARRVRAEPRASPRARRRGRRDARARRRLPGARRARATSSARSRSHATCSRWPTATRAPSTSPSTSSPTARSSAATRRRPGGATARACGRRFRSETSLETSFEVQGVAMAAAGNGDPRRALLLAGAVEALWESLGISISRRLLGRAPRAVHRRARARRSARRPKPSGPRAARWRSTTRSSSPWPDSSAASVGRPRSS